jgi:CheY-like chemotaxis protein
MTTSPSSRRLLLVEDDPAIGRLLARFLGVAGYAVTRASTQAEALTLLLSQSWEVLLTDKNLPDGSGLTIAAAAREQFEELPIVLMTAYPEPLRATSIDGYLAKPFKSLPLVLSTLELAFERRAMARTRAQLSQTINAARGDVAPPNPSPSPSRKAG